MSPAWFWWGGVGILGAVVGSFLNVCSYRLPRGISLIHPRRSFCPACRHSLVWWELFPIFSWLFLRGRCRHCQTPISLRYPLGEALTAGLFMGLWGTREFPLVVAAWGLLAFLIVASFIDWEYRIIPDVLTGGGVVVGCLFGCVLPQGMGTSLAGQGLLRAVLGALVGFLLLWTVMEGGKRAFGKLRTRYSPPVAFYWQRAGERVFFECAGERMQWGEIFFRKNDELLLECVSWKQTLSSEGEEPPLVVTGQGVLRFCWEDLCFLEDKTIALKKLSEVSGWVTQKVLPREAMGFGDVKLLAAIGAFLGWQGVLFTLFMGSLFGAMVGGVCLLLSGRRDPIPFGPFLSLGAVAWLLGGDVLWASYWEHLSTLSWKMVLLN